MQGSMAPKLTAILSTLAHHCYCVIRVGGCDWHEKGKISIMSMWLCLVRALPDASAEVLTKSFAGEAGRAPFAGGHCLHPVASEKGDFIRSTTSWIPVPQSLTSICEASRSTSFLRYGSAPRGRGCK